MQTNIPSRVIQSARKMRQLGYSNASIAHEHGANVAFANGITEMSVYLELVVPERAYLLKCSPGDFDSTMGQLWDKVEKTVRERGFRLLEPFLSNVRIMSREERIAYEAEREAMCDSAAAVAYEDAAYGRRDD